MPSPRKVPTWVTTTVAALGGALLLPELARASGEGDANRGSEALVVLALVGIVAVAYILAHFVLEAVQKRVLILAGLEYVALGVLLGPHMPYEIPVFSALDRADAAQAGGLMPVVALAVGWVGLLRGMEVSFRRWSARTSTGAGRVVVVQALVAGAVTTLAAQAVFSSGWLFPYGSPSTASIVGPAEIWMASGLMGCAAAAGSVEPMELLGRRYRIEGALSDRIRRIASLSDLIAILVFGLLFCIFHEGGADALVQPSPTEWAVVSIALGGLLGVLFTPFLGTDDSDNGRFLAMTGIIVLASGAAYFLDLSPLLVNLVLGVVLVNTARTGPQILKTLESTRKPMSLVLLVFAGALWRPAADPAVAAMVAGGYVALRLVGKALGTYFASWRSEQRRDTYRGLLAHGEVSVAMAVSLRLVYEGPAIDLAYTAVLVSVIVNDLFATRILRDLLVDSGDLRGDQGTQAPA